LSTRRRLPLVAALGLTLAGAVTLAAVDDDIPVGRPLDPDSLRWDAISTEGVLLHANRRPRALLYIQPSCVHCEPAAVLFTSETRRLRVNGLIISGSGGLEAARYARGLPIGEIALDSTGQFRRSAGIRWVPTLVIVPPRGRPRVVVLDSPDLLTTELAGLARLR